MQIKVFRYLQHMQINGHLHNQMRTHRVCWELYVTGSVWQTRHTAVEATTQRRAELTDFERGMVFVCHLSTYPYYSSSVPFLLFWDSRIHC